MQTKMTTQINGILHGNIGEEALLGAFCDDMISNTLVFLMRLITSAEIQRREDHFLPFIMVSVCVCLRCVLQVLTRAWMFVRLHACVSVQRCFVYALPCTILLH